MGLPLEGVRILDMTKALSGPFATMILADMGAEVIKVEPPVRGDDTREMGLFINGESGYFISVNRNKKGITLDMKNLDARPVFERLLRCSDVIVENFKTGTMEKFGFGYRKVAKINPRIIYASCSGFGRTGPYQDKPAFDIIIQAAGGMMSVTGEENKGMLKAGTSIADITAGLYLAIGILGALIELRRTGRGQYIDISMLDCQVATLENAIIQYTSSGEIPRPLGNRHPYSTPFETFICKDNQAIAIAIGNNLLWNKFCSVSGYPELAENKRFRTNVLRTKYYHDTKKVVTKIIKERDSDEWITLFEENRIPVSRICRIDQVMKNPQLQFREMFVETRHPIAGNIITAGSPLNFSLADRKPNRPAPVLGQDSIEVFRSVLGYSDEEINRLRQKNVFYIG